MEKLTKIKTAKDNLFNLINIANNNFNMNNQCLKEMELEYNKILELINECQVFEIYKIESIKNNYNTIKKKISQDKKIYNNIIKLYGNIITYFTDDKNIEIKNNITNLYQKHQDMIYNFLNIKSIHKPFLIKCFSYKKKENILKIYSSNSEITIIIDKLYKSIETGKILNKELYNLKKQRIKFLYD